MAAAAAGDDVSVATAPLRSVGDLQTADDVARLVFFENLYYKLDVDKSGELSLDEATKALSYLAMDLPQREREAIMTAVDDGDAGGSGDVGGKGGGDGLTDVAHLSARLSKNMAYGQFLNTLSSTPLSLESSTNSNAVRCQVE